jgi:orotate phosphoribosyltransferase
MERKDLVERLKDVGVIEKRKVILRSGEKSDFYCDIKKVYGYPEIINALGDEIASRIKNKEGITCIASSGLGGIPIATLVSQKTKLPLVLVRDFKKSHGKQEMIAGFLPTKKDNILIIDDVFTTGSSIMETSKVLEEETHAQINSVFVVVKRGNVEITIPLEYIFNIDELI